MTPPQIPTTRPSQVSSLCLARSLTELIMLSPQPKPENRAHEVHARNGLGGGSVINFGGWSRGNAADYNDWARIFGDQRWSYNGLLPYFLRTKSFLDTEADPKQHRFILPRSLRATPSENILLGSQSRRHGVRLEFNIIQMVAHGIYIVSGNSWRQGIMESVKQHCKFTI